MGYMRIYGLDVKDRKRSKNRSKKYIIAYARTNARGYGADVQYCTTNAR